MRNRAWTMRWLLLVVVLLVVVVGSGCSGGGGGSKSSKASREPACAYVAKLDEIADTVARADVHDPDTFKKTLNTAVHDYVANVKKLRAVAPQNLQAGLARVEADVQQLRFEAALTDRGELDAYAQRTCGRVVRAPSVTTAPAASTSTVATPTTVAGALTATTAPSDG